MGTAYKSCKEPQVHGAGGYRWKHKIEQLRPRGESGVRLWEIRKLRTVKYIQGGFKMRHAYAQGKHLPRKF